MQELLKKKDFKIFEHSQRVFVLHRLSGIVRSEFAGAGSKSQYKKIAKKLLKEVEEELKNL